MSTVGFGDISAVTVFGRIFMMIFISIGLVCKIWNKVKIMSLSEISMTYRTGQ